MARAVKKFVNPRRRCPASCPSVKKLVKEFEQKMLTHTKGCKKCSADMIKESARQALDLALWF